jgi:hypothetical protein
MRIERWRQTPPEHSKSRGAGGSDTVAGDRQAYSGSPRDQPHWRLAARSALQTYERRGDRITGIRREWLDTNKASLLVKASTPKEHELSSTPCRKGPAQFVPTSVSWAAASLATHGCCSLVAGNAAPDRQLASTAVRHDATLVTVDPGFGELTCRLVDAGETNLPG